MDSHPTHAMSHAHEMLMLLHGVYILHVYKGTHGIFKTHASHQASWATTSTTCNFYPYTIHIHISNMHIIACYSSNKSEFFFFFTTQKKQHKQPIFPASASYSQPTFSSTFELWLVHNFPTSITCSRTVFLDIRKNHKNRSSHTNSLIKIVFEPALQLELQLMAIEWLSSKN